MKPYYRNLSIATIIALCMLSCENRQERKTWKHCEGFSVGDILIFNAKDLSLKNDMIILKGTAVAVIERFQKRYFIDNSMFIRSLEDSSIGRYCEK